VRVAPPDGDAIVVALSVELALMLPVAVDVALTVSALAVAVAVPLAVAEPVSVLESGGDGVGVELGATEPLCVVVDESDALSEAEKEPVKEPVAEPEWEGEGEEERLTVGEPLHEAVVERVRLALGVDDADGLPES